MERDGKSHSRKKNKTFSGRDKKLIYSVWKQYKKLTKNDYRENTGERSRLKQICVKGKLTELQLEG